VLNTLILSLLLACSRYEIWEDKQGRAIRVDRWSGEIQIIQGNRVVTPEREPTTTEIQRLAQPRDLGDRTLSQFDNVKAALTTSWREDQLYYRLSIKPFPEKMLKAISGLNLELYDKADFKLLDIDLRTSAAGGGVRSIVDDNGKRTELLFNHSAQCSRDVYSSITQWSLGWNRTLPSCPVV